VRRPGAVLQLDFKITTAPLVVWQKMMPTQGYPAGRLDLDRIVVTPQ
jgi:hypothetical protein